MVNHDIEFRISNLEFQILNLECRISNYPSGLSLQEGIIIRACPITNCPTIHVRINYYACYLAPKLCTETIYLVSYFFKRRSFKT